MHINRTASQLASRPLTKTFAIRALAIAFLSTALSCSTPRSSGNGPGEIDHSPQNTADIETITVMGTNDIHGGLLPLDLKSREPEGVAPIPYQAGGAAYLASFVKKLRSELGDRLLWLDGGDEYQGSIESNMNRGDTMVKVLNTAGLNAAAIGNHEFDFGAEAPDLNDPLSSLKHRMAEAQFPYLAANIFDRQTGKMAEFPKSVPSKIFNTGRIKVGVIGLTTLTTPTTTRPEYVKNLLFGDLKDATLREAKNLREQGADIILLVAHVGLFCDLLHTPPGHILRHPNDLQGECNAKDEMVQLLKSLPAGTVDAVVSGHSHSVVYHYVAGVPVIQGGAYGRYFNLIHLAYNLKEHHLLTDKTTIEGPIPVCPMVFKNQGDCNGDRPAPTMGRGPLVRPMFRREEVRPVSAVESAMEPAVEAAKPIKSVVYGLAARPIEHIYRGESPLGELIADSARLATKADFALVNSGGIRASIEQGPVTYGEIFRILPFEVNLVVLKLTGKQLKLMMQIAENGTRGFHPFSGLKIHAIAPEFDPPAEDLNGDKKIEPWEMNRILSIQTADGDAIEDKKIYTLATLDFLVAGGDDYAWIMNQIPASMRTETGLSLRDVTAEYIKKISAAQGSINSDAHPVFDPANRRLVFEKPKATKKGKHKKRRHKKRSTNS